MFRKCTVAMLIASMLLAVPVRAQAPTQAGPDYVKIGDAVIQIGNAISVIGGEMKKAGVPTPPPTPVPTPTPPPPPAPTPTPAPSGKQLPILTDARIAVLKKMQADNTIDWQYLKANADSTSPLYDDNGRAAAIVYRVTGDVSYAAKAYKLLMSSLNSPDVINANNVREYGVEFTMIYVWIRDALTPEQKLACETQLLKWSDFALARNQTNVNLGGFRTGDSDQTIGQYFMLALMDSVGLGPGNFLDQTGGGPYPTPVGGLKVTANDASTARNAISQFCLIKGKGGTWFESAQYNSNTVVLLLLGWMAMNDVHGQDYFPEIGQWAVSACDAVLTSYTPDFKARLEWGDDERPGSLDFWYQYPYLASMQAAAVRVGSMTQAGHVGAMLDSFPEISKSTDVCGRYFYFVDHSIPSIKYYDGVGPLVNYSPGVGLYSRLDGNNLFAAFCPSSIGVDHENGYVADIMLYCGGEWALRHPVTYGGIANTAVGTNAVLVSGLSAMSNKGPIDCVTTGDYSYYVGNTNGRFYGSWKTANPAPFCYELTRTILYLPKLNAIAVCDRINSVEPSSVVPDMWIYYDNDKATMKAESDKGPGHRHQVNWHVPVGVTPTIATTTAGGEQPYDGITCSWTTAGKQNVVIRSYATSGPIATDTVDEKSLLPAADAFESGSQIRVHFTKDNQWDCVLSLVTINSTAQVQAVTQDATAGWNIGGTSVLFGTDQTNRLVDPTKLTVAGPAYVVGCQGDAAVVAK